MRSRLVAMLLTAGLVVALALPAEAVQTATDPNDTAGPLDVHTLTVNQESNGILHVRIALYNGWNKTIVSQGGPDRWFAYFNTDSDAGWEYRGRIYFANGDLAIAIKGQDGSQYEPLPVHKPTAKALRFTVPGGAPMAPQGVGIATRTIYVAEDNSYFDRAPDQGSVSD
jgi:hypothetical protein